MKQNVLRFHSEKEFQEFFSILSAAELPNFMAVEGSGGDKGFDGIAEKTAFQVYFPEEKNRTDANYINKIEVDLAKVLKSCQELNLDIVSWIFVVPEDLRMDVVNLLLKKSDQTKVRCIYWGASKLKELAYKHTHVIDAFPTVFLPHVRNQVEQVKKLLQEYKPIKEMGVEVITEQDFEYQLREIEREFNTKVTSELQILRAHGAGDSSYVRQISIKHREEANAKRKGVQNKKERSDQVYSYEVDQINKHFNEEKQRISTLEYIYQGDLQVALDEITKQKTDELTKLSIKYGKNNIQY